MNSNPSTQYSTTLSAKGIQRFTNQYTVLALGLGPGSSEWITEQRRRSRGEKLGLTDEYLRLEAVPMAW